MANELIPLVDQFLANRPYQAAFIFVHPEIRQLQTTGTHLLNHYNWPRLSVGNALSQALRNVPPQQRPSRAPGLLADIVRTHHSGPLLCDDIDLLFEPALQLDPLHLLLSLSRTATLLIPWPGSFQNKVLAYAVPTHAHYRIWCAPDLCDYCLMPL